MNPSNADGSAAAATTVGSALSGRNSAGRGAHRVWRVLFIDPRELIRGCLEHWLNCSGHVFEVTGVAALDAADLPLADLLVFSLDGSASFGSWLGRQLAVMGDHRPELPIAIIGDATAEQAARTLCRRGTFLPTSTPTEVAAAVLHLVATGGGYLLPDTAGDPPAAAAEPGPSMILAGQFTPREAAVLSLLERGFANKNIAFELVMSESTVKIHVRNIIRKLRARNRTEAAVLGRALRRSIAASEDDASGAVIDLRKGSAKPVAMELSRADRVAAPHCASEARNRF